ncbi:MAG: CRISPR-associated endoribonuclease Cas6 [Halanaerobiales bacterium]|nr:CRISPR-associated endoribonuclease Cas6 [Halanaerobiales bacterium]
MRLGLQLKLNDPELPLEYRRVFMSFIKNAYQHGDNTLYEKLYSDEAENNTIKPFTFSVYLPEADFNSENGHVLVGNDRIYLNFSTYFYNLGVIFYNGALNLLHQPFYIPDKNHFTLEKINLQRDNKIDSNLIKFKTHSPIVVREHDRDSNLEKYYSSNEKGFIPQLKHNMVESCEHYLFEGKEKKRIYKLIDKMKIEGLNMESITIMHYNHPVIGNSGWLKIKAYPNLLNYLYKSGIGSRRAQGFGKVEVVG